MAEWLYEAGIGESRAALVVDGAIVEAAIERDDGGPHVGAVIAARFVSKGPPALVRFADGEAVLPAPPRGLAEGGPLTIAITREAIPEPGRAKRAKAIPTDAATTPGPDLLARITASGVPVRQPLSHQSDALEEAGWSELLWEAESGEIAFPGGALRLSPTPAMTLFDVDGAGDPAVLALAAAPAIAGAIRRHGIGGSIGIDFPTLSGKAPRLAVAAALDAHLPPPFERTAVNGFGFLQIVRPRPRASLPELLRADPVGAAARAVLRRIEREPPGGPRLHRLPAAITDRLMSRPEWLAALTRRTGIVHDWDL